MKYKNKLIIGLIAIFCILILCVTVALVYLLSLVNQQAKIQSVDISVKVNHESEKGLIVSPDKKYINANPGQTIQETIQVMYDGNKTSIDTKKLKVEIVDLSINRTTCRPSEQRDQKLSVSGWGYFDTSKIKDNSTIVEIPLIIQVPTNVQSGTYLLGVSTKDDLGSSGITTQLIQSFIVVIGNDRSESCLSYQFN